MNDTIMKLEDIQEDPYEVHVLEAIGDGHISFDGSWSIGCDLNPDLMKIGDPVRMWGKGFGYLVRGLAVGEHVAWYRTEEDQRVKNRADELKNTANQKAKFEENRAALDAKYDSLPVVFQKRIDRFRAGNPDFRWEFEAYEMSACIDAVKISDWCKINRQGGETWLTAVRGFKDLSVEIHTEAGISTEHSANSFGVACHLAVLNVLCPPDVEKAHGALTPLVGCEEYGCIH